MIPKIIHYAWVGGAIPENISRNINSWKLLLPDYEFIEWNESNWDVNQSEFTQTMYERRKYSFVVDVMRVDVLSRYGGIYLDTDVKLYRKFDSLLNEQLVIGRLYNNAVGTAVILSKKNHPVMKHMQELYANIGPDIYDNQGYDLVNNGIFTRYLIDQDVGFKFGNKRQRLADGTLILPKQYFEITAFPFEKNTFATHEAVGSWRNHNQKKSFRSNIRTLAQKIVPHAIRARVFNAYCGRRNSIARQYGHKI